VRKNLTGKYSSHPTTLKSIVKRGDGKRERDTEKEIS